VVFQGDANGVSYKNGKNTRNITWTEIDQLQQTDLGLILHMEKQRQYVSKSCLSDEVIAFMVEQHAVSKMN
jgi:PBP1b-binding outer membrane lipoprotein LpoB